MQILDNNGKIYKIRKGFHRPRGLPPALKYINIKGDKKVIKISKVVEFSDSCRYTLPAEDQRDWNKLFGVCFGIFGIHRNSVRFIWRYNEKNDTIDIAKYVYYGGILRFEKLLEVSLYEPTIFTLEINNNICSFIINNTRVGFSVINEYAPDLMFGCGLYFGGNQRAPHDIEVYMQDV